MPYDLLSPLAWVGDDRLVLKDRTRFGLHRRVIARKGDVPDVYGWLVSCQKEAQGAELDHWILQDGDFFVMWIVWKENDNGRRNKTA